MKILYHDESRELIDPADDSCYKPYAAHLVDLPDDLHVRYTKARVQFYDLENELLRIAERAVQSGNAELVIFGSAEDQDQDQDQDQDPASRPFPAGTEAHSPRPAEGNTA